MKVVIALAFLCALAYSVDGDKITQWGTITNILLCRYNITVEGKILRVVSQNVTCASVSWQNDNFWGRIIIYVHFVWLWSNFRMCGTSISLASIWPTITIHRRRKFPWPAAEWVLLSPPSWSNRHAVQELMLRRCSMVQVAKDSTASRSWLLY